jgi:RNA polymerase sigma-70 factor (sigma-E family)
MPARDASFDEFVSAHVRDLMNSAYLISCDESEAEDLVQECLVRVAKRWRRVQTMDLPAAYARRILVNLAIDGGRAQTRRRQELGRNGHDAELLPFGLVDNQAEAAFDAVPDRALLLDALRRLAPQQRAVIVLRYFNDLSEAETAKLLGCSIGTVKSSAARGLERLRDIVTPQRAGTVAPPRRFDPERQSHERHG